MDNNSLNKIILVTTTISTLLGIYLTFLEIEEKRERRKAQSNNTLGYYNF